MKEGKTQCTKPRGPHGATHQEWAYRREAVVWIEGTPIKPNLTPFSGEMKKWLQQQQNANLPIHTGLEMGQTGELSNPYTYSLGALSLSICTIINEACEFADSSGPMDAVDAEIKRIRYESELIIYSARFCETAIKQMLYCTQIPLSLYEKASMGKLLAQECQDCKIRGSERHDISLLGSLAHRFFLCHVIDNCAIDHLQLVARRRNLEAAHSESQSIHPRSVDETRAHLFTSIKTIGNEFGHMADHIGEIEEKMIMETELFIKYYPKPAPITELTQVPVRDLEQYKI